MTLHELLDKPVWQMTEEELLFLAQHGKTHDEGVGTVKSSTLRLWWFPPRFPRR